MNTIQGGWFSVTKSFHEFQDKQRMILLCKVYYPFNYLYVTLHATLSFITYWLRLASLTQHIQNITTLIY